jgi:hypothetical protein
MRAIRTSLVKALLTDTTEMSLYIWIEQPVYLFTVWALKKN